MTHLLTSKCSQLEGSTTKPQSWMSQGWTAMRPVNAALCFPCSPNVCVQIAGWQGLKTSEERGRWQLYDRLWTYHQQRGGGDGFTGGGYSHVGWKLVVPLQCLGNPSRAWFCHDYYLLSRRHLPGSHGERFIREDDEIMTITPERMTTTIFSWGLTKGQGDLSVDSKQIPVLSVISLLCCGF